MLELVDVKPPVVNLRGVVGRMVAALKNSTHNGFLVVDDNGVVPSEGQSTGVMEIHRVIIRAHLQVLQKKSFLPEKRRTEGWEVREKFTWVDQAERAGKIDDVAVTKEEMEMYVDLHPLTNTTPHTVFESLSVAKTLVLFGQVGLRHLVILPRYQATGMQPLLGS